MALGFAALIGVVAVVLTPVALGAADFNSDGTESGSYGASMVSAIVSAKGEEVKAEDLLAGLKEKTCHYIASKMSDDAFDEIGGMSGCQKAVAAALIGGGAVVAVVGAPVFLALIGFTSTGITAGSFAAILMKVAAVANGGGVAAGGWVAFLQAAGATCLTGAANAVVAVTGAVVGWLTSVFS